VRQVIVGVVWGNVVLARRPGFIIYYRRDLQDLFDLFFGKGFFVAAGR